MITDHWVAVEQLLQPMTTDPDGSPGWMLWRTFADQISDRYIILSSRAFDDPEERGLAADDSFATDLRVTVAAGTVDGVAIGLRRVRDLLWPDQHEAVLTVPGRHATTNWVRSESPISVDQSVEMPVTKRFPAFAVETYRLISEPA